MTTTTVSTETLEEPVAVQEMRKRVYADSTFSDERTIIKWIDALYARERALLDAALQAGTGEWVLVPREPTYAMCQAIRGCWEGTIGKLEPFPARYKAMLAAAPNSQNPPETLVAAGQVTGD